MLLLEFLGYVKFLKNWIYRILFYAMVPTLNSSTFSKVESSLVGESIAINSGTAGLS